MRILARRTRLHDLRHFFVSECFQAGVAAPDVQKLAGHLHLHVLQGYAHTSDDSQRRAMAAFSARMNETSSRRNSAVTAVETGAVTPTAESTVPKKSRTKKAAAR